MTISTPVSNHHKMDGAGDNSVVKDFALFQPMDYPIAQSGALEITWHPHWHLHPSTATDLPSDDHSSAPSTIGFVPCPGIGQLTISPIRATFLPLTIMVEDAEITSPPCVVLSPSKTKPLDIKHSSIKNALVSYPLIKSKQYTTKICLIYYL